MPLALINAANGSAATSRTVKTYERCINACLRTCEHKDIA